MIKSKILTLFCSLFLISQLYADKEYKTTNSTNTHIYRSLDYLNLNSIQEAKIKEILVSYKKDFSQYYKKKYKTQKKLQEIISDTYFDEKKYKHVSQELYEDMIELEAKVFKDIHYILNPLQRKQFSNHLQEWLLE
ncbi:MAG: hypothetical protein M0P43_00325 [Arcobacteraceae bacterium]|nr:hypothetical protein [Arcobacteraceae bacterium]